MGDIRFRLVWQHVKPCESNGHIFFTGEKMARTTDDNARLRHIQDCNLYQSQHQRGCKHNFRIGTTNN